MQSYESPETDYERERREAARGRKAHERAVAQGERLREFLGAALSHERGREWFWEQLQNCQVFGNVFVAESATATAFNLGQQNWGKRLFAEIMLAFPDAYTQMAAEAAERDRRDRDDQ